MKRLLLAIALVFVLIVHSPVCWGQSPGASDPGAIQRRSTETLEYYQLRKKVEEKKKPESEEGVVEKKEEDKKKIPQDDRKMIFINRIETDESQILSKEEIAAITRPYEGKQISIKDLFDVVKKINERYKAKNFITAKAFLPPQKVEAGVVKIRLVESRVGRVVVAENPIPENRMLSTGCPSARRSDSAENA